MACEGEVSRVDAGVSARRAARTGFSLAKEIAGDQTNVQKRIHRAVRQGMLGITVSRRGYRESAENGDRASVLLDAALEGVPW